MAVLKRRSRMISFRLSEQEYEHLMALCNERGARSLSDLARDAMQALVSKPNGNGHHAAIEIERLHGRIEELDRELKRLGDLVVDHPVFAGKERAL